MNLTALPVFVAKDLRRLDVDARSIVDGRNGPVAEALDARRLGLAAILMTRRHSAFVAPANTGSHIAFRKHTDGGDGAGVPGARLFAAGRAERTWKNHFR